MCADRWRRAAVAALALLVLSAMPRPTFAQGESEAPQRPSAEQKAEEVGPPQRLESAPPRRRASLLDESNGLVAGIVARVDERAILLSDVVGPVRGRLTQARAQLPLEDYLDVEWELLRRATEIKIQRIVVLKELETRLSKPEQIKRVRGMAAKDFDKYLLRLARSNGMKSREEILAQLKKEGSDLEELRKDFVDNMLAQQYLNELIKNEIREPTRQDLLRYYDEHKDEFREEAGALWRHIEVKFGGDEAAALAKIRAIRQKLEGGADFAELAKQQSDGVMAVAGGLWPVTSKGSFAEKAVDDAIFSLPLDTVSPVIRGESSFHLVRVEKRGDGSPSPFLEVQDECRKGFKSEQIKELRRAKLDELTARHHIESIFDYENVAQPDRRSPR